MLKIEPKLISFKCTSLWEFCNFNYVPGMQSVNDAISYRKYLNNLTNPKVLKLKINHFKTSFFALL